MIGRILATLVVGIGLGAAAPGVAHDLWWEAEEDGFRLVYGHLPSGHAGFHRIPYGPEDVARVHCLREDGGVMTYLDLPEAPVRVSGPYAALHVEMAPAVWTKTPHGTVNLPRTEVEKPLMSWESRESTKHIVRWHPKLARPLGEALEIVPSVDPTALKRGDKLRVTVFLDGLSVAGATVAYNGQHRGVTGADGRVNIRLRAKGFQYLQAELEQPLDSRRADRVVHTAGLGFELEGGR